MRPIEKFEVEACVFGLVKDPARLQEIGAARDADPIVRGWFDLWEAEPEIEPVFVEQGKELAAEYLEFAGSVGRLGDFFATAVDNRLPDGGPVVPRSLMEGWGVPMGAGNYVPVLQGDGGAVPAAEMPEYGVEVTADNVVRVYEPDDAVPYGVVRLLATDGERPLATAVRVMRHQERGGWRLEEPLAELFDGNLVTRQLFVYAIPAREGYFGLFPKAEVEALFGEISAARPVERALVAKLVPELN